MREFKTNSASITERDSITMSDYLHDISRHDLISPDEEVRLATLVRKGGLEGMQAKEKLILANLRFVVSVANQYKQGGVELSDLISEGNIGLIRAVETFDETRGFKFISYAVWWIRQAILNALIRHGCIVRLPHNQQNMLAKFHRMQQETMQREQRALTAGEFAELYGCPESVVQDMLMASCRATSVDSPAAEDSETTLLDMMPSGERTDREMDRESTKQELDTLLRALLSERERFVVESFFGLSGPERSLDDIAAEIGLSRERTRQLCNKALDKLRNSHKTSYLTV